MLSRGGPNLWLIIVAVSLTRSVGAELFVAIHEIRNIVQPQRGGLFVLFIKSKEIFLIVCHTKFFQHFQILLFECLLSMMLFLV